MRHTTRPRRRMKRVAHWLETFWSCECEYHNTASYRCYGCGRRPPRRLRAAVAALAVPLPPPPPVQEPEPAI